jgi:hypothetical protein
MLSTMNPLAEEWHHKKEAEAEAEAECLCLMVLPAVIRSLG